jgi:Arc/MetJ-type ribon-helix-helix transcriptional regulator
MVFTDYEAVGGREHHRLADALGLPAGTAGRDLRCSTICILTCMTTPVPTRFTDTELALIDQLVAEGVGDSRSAVIRRSVHHLADSVRRARIGASIAASYRDHPQTPDDDELAMATAIAMTEAEPW